MLKSFVINTSLQSIISKTSTEKLISAFMPKNTFSCLEKVELLLKTGERIPQESKLITAPHLMILESPKKSVYC